MPDSELRLTIMASVAQDEVRKPRSGSNLVSVGPSRRELFWAATVSGDYKKTRGNWLSSKTRRKWFAVSMSCLPSIIWGCVL